MATSHITGHGAVHGRVQVGSGEHLLTLNSENFFCNLKKIIMIITAQFSMQKKGK